MKCFDGSLHIVPLNDLREHELNKDCWCQPDEDEDSQNLWKHHALDDRESYENGRPLQ